MRLEDMREQFPKMPESMKQMIEQEVAVQIGQEKENNNPKVVTYKKRKKKNMAHRMLVASMVAALALATTVCAGVAYQMHNEKVGKYGLKTQIEGPQTAAESTENMADQTTEERAGKAAEYVRLETSYLPKGMVQSVVLQSVFLSHIFQPSDYASGKQHLHRPLLQVPELPP